MNGSSRILVNTGILYIKSIFSIIIILFTTRFVLSGLGENDFGIYSLIGGIFGFLSYLTSTLAGSTQRFLSYYRNNKLMVSRVFNSSVLLHFLIGVFIVLLFELGSIFLFSGSLNIDSNRLQTSKVFYQFMVFSTFLAVLSGPYDAIIISQENMLFNAFAGIVESIGKLLIAIFVLYWQWDQLYLYGFLMMLLSFTLFISKAIYCDFKYSESKIIFSNVDKLVLKEITGFSLWTTLDTFFHILRDQGMTVLINIYYGLALNAAHGIAKQVGGQIAFFSNVIFKASTPQVTGHISRGAKQIALDKSLSICKLSFLLMSLFSLPLILEMPFVLKIWLGKVPLYAIMYCRLTLIATLIYMVGAGLNYLIEGIGEIRSYRIISSLLSAFSLLVAFVLGRINVPPYSIYIGIIISNVGLLITMVYFTVRYTNLTWSRFLIEIVLRLIPMVIGICVFIYSIPYSDSINSFIRLTVSTIISSLLIVFLSWLFALNKWEKSFAKRVIMRILQKIFNRFKLFIGSHLKLSNLVI